MIWRNDDLWYNVYESKKKGEEGREEAIERLMTYREEVDSFLFYLSLR